MPKGSPGVRRKPFSIGVGSRVIEFHRTPDHKIEITFDGKHYRTVEDDQLNALVEFLKGTPDQGGIDRKIALFDRHILELERRIEALERPAQGDGR